MSTGPLENMNNKIKTLKRRSYGFCACIQSSFFAFRNPGMSARGSASMASRPKRMARRSFW
ncbi:MAG: transposase [Planctomycetaceae bacterium]|nr:transposase [Planctomycetaceae bacterium]